jgi:hypothetical protein
MPIVNVPQEIIEKINTDAAKYMNCLSKRRDAKNNRWEYVKYALEIAEIVKSGKDCKSDFIVD